MLDMLKVIGGFSIMYYLILIIFITMDFENRKECRIITTKKLLITLLIPFGGVYALLSKCWLEFVVYYRGLDDK